MLIHSRSFNSVELLVFGMGTTLVVFQTIWKQQVVTQQFNKYGKEYSKLKSEKFQIKIYILEKESYSKVCTACD